MAELVDALDSKSGIRKDVQVRFLFQAQKKGDVSESEHSLFSFPRSRSLSHSEVNGIMLKSCGERKN